MDCRSCKKPIPEDAIYCHLCGTMQNPPKKPYKRTRGNGFGTAYKRGRTWTAEITTVWNPDKGSDTVQRKKRKKGGFATKREALEYLPILRESAPEPPKRTFQHYWEIWRDGAMQKLSPSKQDAYSIAQAKIADWLHRPVAGTGVGALQGIVDEAGTSYYTARDIKTLLSHIYKLAIADEIVTSNIALHVSLPKLIERDPIPFNEDEVKKLWDDYLAGNKFTGYLLLMIYSGMMPGELFIAKKSMIDWDKQQIIGCGLKTNIRKTSPLAIADFMVPVLRNLCDASDGWNVLPMPEHAFYSTFRETISRLELRSELTPYSCRHTTATALALKNTAPSVIQKTMRHAKFTTTQRYIHPDTDDVLGAINKLQTDDDP